ncbi:N-acetylmuramic acid 6-phosphate etherase [Parelusimicrobium proximum]|uniref:N-acetylmuramic acid 6-phosphate etherase n=1 Tax=Parelusimicrobium proximum TaxID=3228953 RepID=UPI003D16244E
MKKVYLIPTETLNKRTADISRASVRDMIGMMNYEDMAAVKAVKKAEKEIERAIKKTAEVFKKGGNIYFIGAGTSGRLGVLEAAECPPTFSTSPDRIVAVMAGGKNAVFKSKEGAEDDAAQGAKDIGAKIKKGDILFGIAASGQTPYVLGALKKARELKVNTVFVTCNDKADKKAADTVIILNTGPEALQGSTRLKAGTATKLALNTITTCTMVLCGKTYKNYMVDVKASNKKLEKRALRHVCTIAGADEKTAERLLKETKFNVKESIVMAKLKVSKKEAAALLKKHGGYLEKII